LKYLELKEIDIINTTPTRIKILIENETFRKIINNNISVPVGEGEIYIGGKGANNEHLNRK